MRILVLAIAMLSGQCFGINRDCKLELTDFGSHQTWTLKVREGAASFKLSPLARPASYKEAMKACERFLKPKKTHVKK